LNKNRLDENQSYPYLRAENLSYSAEGQAILSNINFEISEGERIAIFGPSGAGKSTLIRLLNRLDEPTSGKIFIHGQDYREIPPQQLRRKLGLVMQQPHLFPGTVADSLRFGPEAQGKVLAEDEIQNLLAGVDLAGFADRDVSKLSGGEAQRVSLARTLANKPEALLLDEPTSSLDEAARIEVEETILSVLNSQDVTCILVTHDRGQVQRMANRVILLKSGEIVEDNVLEGDFDAQSMD